MSMWTEFLGIAEAFLLIVDADPATIKLKVISEWDVRAEG